MPFFFTCKQVSHQLSREDYAKLSPWGRFTLQFHVWICPVCGAYNRQVMKFHDLMRRYRHRKESELSQSGGGGLDDAARRRMVEALRSPPSGDAILPAAPNDPGPSARF